MKRLN
ncbi:hypothetical protein VCEC0009_001295A, partial [Vibrio cholerae O1 str. EC-0009]|jgi:hypothetical protein